MIVHCDFEAAFRPGHVFKSDDGDIPVRQIVAGNLVAPSGRIVASDPAFLTYNREPFRRVAPQGTHRVTVAVAELSPGNERVACARVRFGRGKPVRWELALKRGEKLGELGPNQFYGYGVDSGTGCFVDAAAVGRVRRASARLTAAMGRATAKGGFCGVIPVGRWGGPTLVGFLTGVGDGSYPSFWGFDRAGRLVTLDTDFQLLVRAVMADVVFDGVMRRLGETLQDAQMKEAGFAVRVRRRRDRAMPLEVERTGPCGDFTPCLLLGSEEMHFRQSAHGDDRATYAFRIARARLTKDIGLKLTFLRRMDPLK